ncbi:hypothetical protein J537_3077 [Acinetobacter baumannii 1437282]|nr:hypothetical protein J537_3077 [Acinetobacter baumannii 1437282]
MFGFNSGIFNHYVSKIRTALSKKICADEIIIFHNIFIFNTNINNLNKIYKLIFSKKCIPIF